MTESQLRSVMKFQLRNFNDEGVAINDGTLHQDVLSESDGYGTANSKNIYKAVIRRTLRQNDHEDKRWPENWMGLSVADLSTRLI